MAVLSGALLSSEAAKARVNELPTQCPRSFNALAQLGLAMFSVKYFRLRNLSPRAYRQIGRKISGPTLSGSLDDPTADTSQDIHIN